MENIQKKIGIIGGGQLGQMMILEAKKMGFYITMLDPEKKCPAHTLVDEHIIADFHDKESIRLLAEKSDVITYEFEHIDADILETLEAEGKQIYPTAKSLKLIQNKYKQKQILKDRNIPVPDFTFIKNVADLEKACDEYNTPLMLKACTGGYDGNGNFCVDTKEDCKAAFSALGGGSLPLMAERFFPFVMEISVLACRGTNGEIQIYPVAENIHVNSILEETRVPANISHQTTKNAMDLAKQVMEIFEGVGMFCVEMFVDKEGNLALNEVAPRPHNSGHYTIEACVTNQFEQHIRAVSGLPLGCADLVYPAVMRNILGAEGTKGKTLVRGADDLLAIRGAFLHLYGKKECRPKRKMGHLTVVAKTVEDAHEKGKLAKKSIHVYGAESL